MVYMGSKNRLSKDIIGFIELYYDKNKNYYEPFVGGANLIDKIDKNGFKNIIGSDYNEYLIALLNKMKTNDKIEFNFIEKDDYYNNHKYPFHKDNKNYIKKYEKWYIGYIGFTKTFSGIFMHSYAGNKDNDNKSKRNYQKILHNNIIKQRENIKHIEFIYSDYLNLKIENNSIIYLDPPYFNTTKYSKGLEINQDKFYEWCKDLVYNKNCIVLLSEYNVPDYFELIFEKKLESGLGQKKQTEKLFILKK